MEPRFELVPLGKDIARRNMINADKESGKKSTNMGLSRYNKTKAWKEKLGPDYRRLGISC